METVCVRHTEREWTVRACVLGSVSQVFAGIFEHTSDAERVLPIDGPVRAVGVFLAMAHAVSFDAVGLSDEFDEPVDVAGIGVLRLVDDDVLELIYRYEAYGLLRHVQTLLARAPSAELIVRVCAWFPERTEWCSPSVCACVGRHLEPLSVEQIAKVPATLLARVLVARRSSGVKIFRPALDERSLVLSRQSLSSS